MSPQRSKVWLGRVAARTTWHSPATQMSPRQLKTKHRNLGSITKKKGFLFFLLDFDTTCLYKISAWFHWNNSEAALTFIDLLQSCVCLPDLTEKTNVHVCYTNYCTNVISNAFRRFCLLFLADLTRHDVIIVIPPEIRILKCKRFSAADSSSAMHSMRF